MLRGLERLAANHQPRNNATNPIQARATNFSSRERRGMKDDPRGESFPFDAVDGIPHGYSCCRRRGGDEAHSMTCTSACTAAAVPGFLIRMRPVLNIITSGTSQVKSGFLTILAGQTAA